MGAKPKPGHPPEEWLVHGRDLVANAQTDMAEAARAFKGNSANVKAARDIQRQLSKLEDRIQALVDSALGN